MEKLPLELENMILDYKGHMEWADRMKKVHKQLLEGFCVCCQKYMYIDAWEDSLCFPCMVHNAKACSCYVLPPVCCNQTIFPHLVQSLQ